MFAAINHLHFEDPVAEETLVAFRNAGRAVVDAGGLSEQVVKVNDKHLGSQQGRQPKIQHMRRRRCRQLSS